MAEIDPLISVIIPAHNSARTLHRAVDSMRRQTYRNIEIIIVDDSSTDATRAVAEKEAGEDSRVRVIAALDDPHRFDKSLKRNVNAGWSARNAGLSIARGEYITFQDADDASLLNRIEIQFMLLRTYRAIHLTTNCRALEDTLLRTVYAGLMPGAPSSEPDEIAARARRAKGIVPTLFPSINRVIPFRLKRLRAINKLFFGTLEHYPGAGNSPLFHRSVIERVRFRPLSERLWPSFMGRGADRDFNFQVAETFKNSYYFDIPLYLWNRL